MKIYSLHMRTESKEVLMSTPLTREDIVDTFPDKDWFSSATIQIYDIAAEVYIEYEDLTDKN